jgi:hypothetical protein
MDKKEIKILVRESLSGLFEKSKKQNSEKEVEEKKTEKKDNDSEDKEDNSASGGGESDKPLDKRDQHSIQQRLKQDLSPSMTDVCVSSGVFPNAHNNGSQRSACRKKLLQKDGQGLEDDEKDSIEATLKIK